MDGQSTHHLSRPNAERPCRATPQLCAAPTSAALLPFQPDLPAAATIKQAPTSATLEQVDQWVSAVQGMPWLLHVGIAVALLAGIALWLRGKPLLKPATSVLAAAGGGVLGFVLLPVLAPGATVPPWLAMIAGALAGAMVMIALHRLLAALVFGAVLACALATITSGILSVTSYNRPAIALAQTASHNTPSNSGGDEQPIKSSSPEIAPATAPSLSPRKTPPQPPQLQINPPKVGGGRLGGEDPSPHDQPARPSEPKPIRLTPTGHTAADSDEPTQEPEDFGPQGRTSASRGAPFDPHIIADSKEVAQSARTLWSASQQSWNARWDGVPGAHKLYILAAAIIGLVGGTFAGLLQPAWAAAVLSAIAGSGIMLASGIWLAHATGIPGHRRIGLAAVDFSVIWVTLALIGVAAQWRYISGSAGKEKGGGRSKRSRPAKGEPAED